MVILTLSLLCILFFFFNDTATTEIYTLSLHDALPISAHRAPVPSPRSAARPARSCDAPRPAALPCGARSEEHTSELQSRRDLVCRLLLEKKKNNNTTVHLNLTLNVYQSYRSYSIHTQY